MCLVHFLTPFSSCFPPRNMTKGESLMGEVATDWNDSECPEAKRLKVLPASLDSFLWGSKWGLPGQLESPGKSLFSLLPQLQTITASMWLCCRVRRNRDLPWVPWVGGSPPSPSGSTLPRFLLPGLPRVTLEQPLLTRGL